jgi:thiamine-monophosphate kinase
MFENQERTHLEELGEFGLIDHLTKNIVIKHPKKHP